MSSSNGSDHVDRYDEQAHQPVPYGSFAVQPTQGPFVPQTVYVPLTEIDRRRYVDGVTLDPPITFWLRNPDQEGISLRDAINVRFGRLVGKDDLMFLNRGPSISIRLQVGSLTTHISKHILRSLTRFIAVARLPGME